MEAIAIHRQRTQSQGGILVSTLAVLSLLPGLRGPAGFIVGGLMPERQSIVQLSAFSNAQDGGRQPQNGNC